MRGLERGMSAVSLTPRQERVFHHDKNPSIGHQVIGRIGLKFQLVIWMNWGGGAMAFSRTQPLPCDRARDFTDFICHRISDNLASWKLSATILQTSNIIIMHSGTNDEM